MTSSETGTLEPEQLQTLFEKFIKKCGTQKDGFMTREIFADFIETDTKFFNDRLFMMIDKDQTGKISFKDFRTFVERYSGQTYELKLDFLFNLYDVNGDKKLDRRELKAMLKSNMLENGVKLDDTDVDSLVTTLLEEALGDEGNDSTKSFLTQEDLHNLFQSHAELIENLSTIIEKWLQPVSLHKKPQRKKTKKPKSLKRTMKWIQNNKPFLFGLLAYILTNIVLFVTKILIFINDEKTMNMSKYLAIARGCGWCLDFNGGFILLVMMRHMLTRLRSTWFNHILPIDDHRFFHELCGKVIVALSLLHMIMHLLNVNVVERETSFSDYLFNVKATQLGLIPGFAYISGFVLILILGIMVTGTLPYFRHNGFFRVFYISHRACYPLFFIFLILHCKDFWKWFVTPGILFFIEQIFRTYCNYFGFKTFVESGITLSSKVTNLVIKRPNGFNFSAGDYIFINIPEFSWSEWHPFTISSAPENLDEITLHISAKGAWTTQLYEYFNRINTINRNRRLPISRPTQAVKVSSRQTNSVAGTDRESTSIQNLRRRLSSKSQYSYLRKRPTSVRLSTLDSEDVQDRTAPEHPTRSRIVSSDSQSEVFESPEWTPSTYGSSLKVYIDGPYGAPSSDIFLAEHAVLIGGGIGVTPFASILQSIMYRHLESKLSCPSCDHKFSRGLDGQVNRLKKVDFYWINRDQNAFEWFTNLLSKLEIEQKELDGQLERFLDIHMYMTKALQRSDMRAVALQLAFDLQYAKTERDLLAGLKARMRTGRPKWDKIFKSLNVEKKGNVVVFFCGPPQLGSQLNSLCNHYGFTFKTETF